MDAYKISDNLKNVRENNEKEINYIIKNLENFKDNFARFGQDYLPKKEGNLFKR